MLILSTYKLGALKYYVCHIKPSPVPSHNKHDVVHRIIARKNKMKYYTNKTVNGGSFCARSPHSPHTKQTEFYLGLSSILNLVNSFSIHCI